jgi:hypothetical protein
VDLAVILILPAESSLSFLHFQGHTLEKERKRRDLVLGIIFPRVSKLSGGERLRKRDI